MTIRPATLSRQPVEALAALLRKNPANTAVIDVLYRRGEGALADAIVLAEGAERTLEGKSDGELSKLAYFLDQQIALGDPRKGGVLL